MIHFFDVRFGVRFDAFLDMRGAPAFGDLIVRLVAGDFFEVEVFFLATMVGAQLQRRGQR